ncbi:hypothetical protein NL676_036544 [Syzygium grande]|nr:hypothetical protein NL676_036544 [Syzygium grande]
MVSNGFGRAIHGLCLQSGSSTPPASHLLLLLQLLGSLLALRNRSRHASSLSRLRLAPLIARRPPPCCSATQATASCIGRGPFGSASCPTLLSSPTFPLLSLLISACGDARRFDLVLRILDRLSSAAVPPGLLRQAHSVAISCFADHAQLRLMEHTLSLMLSRGFPIDSATGDAFLRYYSSFASLDDMENAYSWLKRSRHLPSQVGITAVALAYVRDRKLYRLGQFLRDVGLGRKDLGNLLWNLLLFSYAANFKMKSLQREFLNMVRAGFCPDVTTFNIRLLAFSTMSMFWDLHLSLEHMKRTGIVPDLVTYGCVVDSYLDRRLGRNLRFVLDKMNLDDAPQFLIQVPPLDLIISVYNMALVVETLSSWVFDHGQGLLDVCR